MKENKSGTKQHIIKSLDVNFFLANKYNSGAAHLITRNISASQLKSNLAPH
jgi:hypothetical protein